MSTDPWGMGWNSIAAIAQIFVAFTTLGAVLVSLYLAKLPGRSIAEVRVNPKSTIFKPYFVKLINTGQSIIYIKSYGILLRKDSIHLQSTDNTSIFSRLETKEIVPKRELAFIVYDKNIAEKSNLKHGDKVKLWAYFIDSKDTIFKKRFVHTIQISGNDASD